MDRFSRFITLVSLSFYVLTAFLLSVSGPLNNDEGWYLYASKLVYQGKVLYRDFFFTQPPVFPYIYGLAQELFGSGVVTGRFTSVVLGTLCLLVAIQIARKLGGNACTIIAAGLLIFNPFQVYFFSIVKTYALSSLLLLLSLYMTVSGRTFLRPAAAVLMVMAVGTRLILAPALPVLLYFLVRHRSPRSVRVWTIVATAVSFAFIFIPFWIADHETFYYGLIGYHSELYGGGWRTFLMLRVLLLVELVRGYPLALALFGVALVGRAVRKPDGLERDHSISPVLAVFIVLFVAQLTAPPPYAEYFTAMFPLAAILVGVAAERFYLSLPVRRGGWKFRAAVFFAVGCVLSMSFTRPTIIPQGKPQLQDLVKVAQYVREHSSPEDKLFTMDARIAVQADREVLPGMEMAAFSYFEDWDTDRCRRYNVINDEIALEYASRRDAKIAIVTSTSFTMKAPSLLPADRGNKRKILRMIEQKYRLLETFPDFLAPNNVLFVFIAE